MAKLFLSYSRKDEAKARRFTSWLEREGHDVWRDEEDISGGASFSAEIEKALEDCDAVLVLWSANSVQSAWVRDEAGYGRDRGKLIPFSLDATESPLGFRQFQSLALQRWSGNREPRDPDRIRRAIARTTGQGREGPAPRPEASRRRFDFGLDLPRPWLAGGIVAALAFIALSLFLWQRWGSGGEIAISVLPSPQSTDRAMAADYANAAAADMASFLPTRFDRATVISPSDASDRDAGYRMRIATNAKGPAVDASLTLSDADGRTTLWSRTWSVADASAADLKTLVSAAASKAALCLTDAKGGSVTLSQPALGLYLSGCAGLGDSEGSNVDYEAVFGRLTRLVPDFPPGWSYLALSRSWIAESLRDGSPAPYAAAVKRTQEAIATARRLNPDSARTYDAEYHLYSNDRFRALQILTKGVEANPDDGLLQMHLADELLSVGRMSDSVDAAQRAVALEPGSPYARSEYISALVVAGQFSKAKAEIAAARKKWPNAPEIDFAEFTFQFRYGEPRTALELLPKIGNQSDADLALSRKVIEARANPTPARIDDAIAALEARWGKDPRTRGNVFRALGEFGRFDQAYRMLEDPAFQPFVETDVLFRPDYAGLRADPRFMAVAARLGLVRYWRESGYWPDFCSSERLSYDCKAESAKYPN